MKVKEIIVVEGKHDTQKIKSFVDCDTLETNGCHMAKDRLALIATLQKQRGVIIFTDPDTPGEQIRRTINQAVPGCKNAFIEKKKARTVRKVGVEHADGKDIMEALAHVITYVENPQETLSWTAFLQLGLSGQPNSANVREILGNTLFIGKCNAKTLWKRLNMLGLHKQDVEQILKTNDI